MQERGPVKGTFVQLNAFDGTKKQQWYFEPADLPKISDVPEGGKTYSIRVRHSGQYLDVQNFGTSEDTKVMTYYYNGGENQQFRLMSHDTVKDAFYLLPVHAPGMALTESTTLTEAGYPRIVLSRLVQGKTTQMFRFQEVASGKGYLIENHGIDQRSLDVPYSAYTKESSIIATGQPAGGAVPANKHWILEACSDRIVTSMTYTDGGRNVKTVPMP